MAKCEKTTFKDWCIVLVALLDDAAVLALIFLGLWFFKVKIPLPVVIIVALLLGGVIFLLHRAIIPSLHKRKTTGSEGMIGMTGEVIKPLTPFGVVKINGECWKAKSVGENIEAGADVEVLSLKGLNLEVRRKVND